MNINFAFHIMWSLTKLFVVSVLTHIPEFFVIACLLAKSWMAGTQGTSFADTPVENFIAVGVAILLLRSVFLDEGNLKAS